MKRIDHSFTQTLIDWYSRAKRDLPWRKTKNPYNVWLSEIILQQTRVEQGLPYYENFVRSFPTVHDLADAPEQKVMKAWEGLGYYSRARNLHHTAKFISKDRDGIFPGTYSELLKLKGVGPYTAAAIASICFGERVPVIDGNVFRFTSRHFGVEKDISDSKNRKYFEDILLSLIPSDDPGAFNQAMMEFGATICAPTNPKCDRCDFSASCYAFERNIQDKLPVKKGKVKVQERFIAYLIFDTGSSTLMRVRTRSFWTGLYEFYGLELDEPAVTEVIHELLASYSGFRIKSISEPVKHLLSHRKLWVTFYTIQVSDVLLKEIRDDFKLNEFSWEEVLTLPCPKVIVNYLHREEF